MLNQLTSLTTIHCIGAKAADFLQGQLTCDMRLLSEHGRFSLAACCDHRGRMLANFWVMNWHNDYYLVLPKDLAEIVKTHLQKYAVFSKVTLTLNDTFFIAEFSQPKDKDFIGIYVTLPGSNRTLFISDQHPAAPNMIHSDENTWKKNNIADGIALLSTQTSLLFTPAMINLDKLGGVSFNKGCYVGQEIVARTHYLGTLKRHLQRLEITHPTPLPPGAELKNAAGEVMGIVVEAVHLGQDQYEVLAVVQGMIRDP